MFSVIFEVPGTCMELGIKKSQIAGDLKKILVKKIAFHLKVKHCSAEKTLAGMLDLGHFPVTFRSPVPFHSYRLSGATSASAQLDPLLHGLTAYFTLPS